MSQTPLLALPLLQASQAQKHVTHNEALKILDAATQLSVLSADLTDPPSSPAEGDRHIPAPGPTGAWAGRGGDIAIYADGAWQFFEARQGWRADVIPTGATLRFDGSIWEDVSPDLQNIDTLGVNATADATNRLAVASDATLLTHDGDDHQLKINKATLPDTASLLFQNGFSGRAEMGLAGADDFSIKVSSDGSTWYDGLTLSHGNGNASIGTNTIANDSKLRVVIDGGGPWNTAFERYINNAGAHNFLFRKARGSASSPVSISTGDSVMSITAQGHDGAGFSAVGVLRFSADTVSSGDISGRMTIEVADTSGALQPRLSIDEEGNIGLGTSTPSARLDVDGAIRPGSYTVATLPSAATTGAGAMVFVSDETGGAVMAFSDGTNWRRMTDRVVVS